MSNRLPILAAEIEAAHQGVMLAAKTAAERAVEAGHLLIEAKAMDQHGEWLPWLKNHCGLSTRTAQFYMKIAKLGLKSETVAYLGIKAASEAVEMAYPDPFAGLDETDRRAWQLYFLRMVLDGYPAAGADHYITRMRRQNWQNPDQWLGEMGSRYRKLWGMGDPPEEHRQRWRELQAAYADKTGEEIATAIDDAASKAPEFVPAMPKKRRGGR